MQATDAAVLFVSSRLLRRVLRADLDPAGSSYRVLRRRHHVIARDRLLEILDPDELPANLESRPDKLILLEPNLAVEDGPADRESALRFFWRELFAARIAMVLTRPDGSPRFSEEQIRLRRHRLGEVEFNEARLVMQQEHLVLDANDDAEVYVAFAVRWLELRHFEPRLVEATFPGIRDHAAVDLLLAEDVDAAHWLELERPAAGLLAEKPTPTRVGPRRSRERKRREPNRLLAGAERLRAMGNVVRSALYRAEAEGVEAGDADLGLLATRLENALPRSEDSDDWHAALRPLLAPAVEQYWSVEARLLYELQKACVAQERKIYSTNAVEWVLWLGKRDLVRPLPLSQVVTQIRALRKARQLLDDAAIEPFARLRLDALIVRAVEQLESRLRDDLIPKIALALEAVGLMPQNPPERLATTKLTGELTDRLIAWGFLTFGDVRDALARNQLKLRDLASPTELIGGDALLALDRVLAEKLDGVYRRGEVYLRYLQSVSSLAFGTSLGRAATLYVTLPFGGAFMVIAFLQYLIHELGGPHVELVSWGSVLVLGGIFLALLHVPVAQAFARHLLYLLGRGLYWSFITLPSNLLRIPFVRRVLNSSPVLFFRRHLLEATLCTSLTLIGCWWTQTGTSQTIVLALSVFASVAVFANTVIGRMLREAASDLYFYVSHRFWTEVVLGLYRGVLEAFRLLVSWTERLLYTIDELTRFHEGESRKELTLKIILGVFWFYIRYTIRFVFNLFVEPQFNPLKHFPTVTVGHKLILPLAPHIGYVLSYALGIDVPLAIFLATMFLSLIPGMFGFIVWELKENWRLYQANRPDDLQPILIGSHGERMIDLFVPGFHSGTVPRLFARLREAIRRDDAGKVHRVREELHHVELEVRTFVDRECRDLLTDNSLSWERLTLTVGKVRLSLKRVEVELVCPTVTAESLILVFEEHYGRLAARLRRTGWLAQISGRRGRRFKTALAGLYKLAGVSLLRDPIAEELGRVPAQYAIHPERLLAWKENRPTSTAGYSWPLLNGDLEADADGWPKLPAAALDFRLNPITWEDWVESWKRDEKKQAELTLPRTSLRLLGAAEDLVADDAGRR